jgi:hypothetical protein
MTKKLLATGRSAKACEKRLRILTKPLMITALSAKDRKVVEERLKILSALKRQCEGYLRDYMAGGQNVAKFHNIMRYVHEDTEETLKELLKIHGLPPDFMEPVRKEEERCLEDFGQGARH